MHVSKLSIHLAHVGDSPKNHPILLHAGGKYRKMKLVLGRGNTKRGAAHVEDNEKGLQENIAQNLQRGVSVGLNAAKAH